MTTHSRICPFTGGHHLPPQAVLCLNNKQQNFSPPLWQMPSRPLAGLLAVVLPAQLLAAAYWLAPPHAPAEGAEFAGEPEAISSGDAQQRSSQSEAPVLSQGHPPPPLPPPLLLLRWPGPADAAAGAAALPTLARWGERSVGVSPACPAVDPWSAAGPSGPEPAPCFFAPYRGAVAGAQYTQHTQHTQSHPLHNDLPGRAFSAGSQGQGQREGQSQGQWWSRTSEEPCAALAEEDTRARQAGAPHARARVERLVKAGREAEAYPLLRSVCAWEPREAPRWDFAAAPAAAGVLSRAFACAPRNRSAAALHAVHTDSAAYPAFHDVPHPLLLLRPDPTGKISESDGFGGAGAGAAGPVKPDGMVREDGRGGGPGFRDASRPPLLLVLRPGGCGGNSSEFDGSGGISERRTRAAAGPAKPDGMAKGDGRGTDPCYRDASPPRFFLQPAGAQPGGKNAGSDGFGSSAAERLSSLTVRTVVKVGQLPRSEYYRKGKLGWIGLKNVCLSCEAERDPWMDHRRPCHTTVWTLHGAIRELAAPQRKGRHSIYKQRQAAFQHGGSLSDPAQPVVHYEGTHLYLSAYPQQNVGHALHDALFLFASVLLSLGDVKSHLFDYPGTPAAVRVIIEPDFYRNSMLYYSVLAAVLTRTATGAPPFVFEHVRTGGLRHPPEAGGERAACSFFDGLIFTGEDRELKGAGVAGGSRVATVLGMRRAIGGVLDGLLPRRDERPHEHPAHSPPPVRVYLYGRTDVYRRSIVNFDDLIASVSRGLANSGIPPITVIPTTLLPPLGQVQLFRSIDVLLTIQGAHMQTSLFMPADGAVIEISPCAARKTSFLRRYGTMLPTQNHVQMEICFPSVNLLSDKYAQNVTLCPHHVDLLLDAVLREVRRLQNARAT
ncbi:hypothetical protein DIPPA_21641 [Diplonema papillatum]|nr:hypothetical protein DIPPA_21641 [Diplonema papillatum]